MEAPTTAALVATAMPWHVVDPIALFGAARAAGLDAALWHEPARGHSLVGIGVAARLATHGRDRFECLARQWRGSVARTRVTGPAADSPLAGPMLVGGASFREHPSTDARWSGFETARFDVPRVLVAVSGATAVLTTVQVTDDGAMVEHGPELVERLLAGWIGEADPTPVVGVSVRGLEPDRQAWGSSVARIAGAVGRGRLDKVVLARRVDLVATRAIDPVGVLRRLAAADGPDPTPGERLASTLFAFGHGERTFLGSSPERLASVRGERLRTMALAGTAPRGGGPAADARLAAALLASEKDREEHAVVATMLRETLRPLVADLVLPRTPRVVRSARLHHLLTDATATLRARGGLLELAGLLHPTPAVGGWPTDAALDLLDEQVDIDRGWYAGPVGWIDRNGDGDLAVAIRSGVVAGTEASLFAGCGIVADSEPDREWDESVLKLGVMGDALGWVDR
jgi:isochorismate synthase